MAQLLKVPSVLAQNLDSVPNTLIPTQNYLWLQFQGFWHPQALAHTWRPFILRNTNIHINSINNLLKVLKLNTHTHTNPRVDYYPQVPSEQLQKDAMSFWVTSRVSSSSHSFQPCMTVFDKSPMKLGGRRHTVSLLN